MGVLLARRDGRVVTPIETLVARVVDVETSYTECEAG